MVMTKTRFHVRPASGKKGGLSRAVCWGGLQGKVHGLAALESDREVV